MTYQSSAPLQTQTTAHAGVALTSVSGGTFTNLTFNPVPNINQTSIIYNENGEVASYNLLTKTAAPLTTLVPISQSTSPSFSHDGRVVFYGLYQGKSTLMTMEADGSSVAPIATINSSPLLPAFSPLNNLIAYSSAVGLKIALPTGSVAATGATAFGGTQFLWVVATGGTFTLTFKGQTTAALPYNATGPQVQTALDNLSTIGGASGSVNVTASSGLFQINFAGAMANVNEPAITLSPALGGVTEASITECVLAVEGVRPAWSPNGTQFAASVEITAPTFGYYVYGIGIYNTSGALLSVIPEQYYISGLAYTPDAQKLVLSENVSGVDSIFGHDLASGTEWLIHSGATGGDDQQPTVSPDGGTVAFSRNTSPPSIWTVSIGGVNPALLISSDSIVIDNPDWMPYPAKKVFLGTGGSLGTSASGFLFGQASNGFGSLVTFTAKTPTSVSVSSSGLTGTGFIVKADSLTALSYTNSYYGANVSVIPGQGAAVAQVLVLFNLTTGTVTGAASITPKAPVSSVKNGSGVVYTGKFLQVWDAKGKLVASNATTISTDDTKAKLTAR